MSTTTILGVTPCRRPVELLELRNAHGWSPGIWNRLTNYESQYILDDPQLERLWKEIEDLPEWQQVPLVLTFDTGVIPWQEFEWAAEQLDRFEREMPAKSGHVNHIPAVADLFRSKPEVLLIGVHGTSVTENPFDPWDDDADEPGNGIELREMYLLGRHHHHFPPSPYSDEANNHYERKADDG